MHYISCDFELDYAYIMEMEMNSYDAWKVAIRAMEAIENCGDKELLQSVLADKDVAVWWKTHKAELSKREEAQRKEAEKEAKLRELRKIAASKLTEEELELLGFNKNGNKRSGRRTTV